MKTKLNKQPKRDSGIFLYGVEQKTVCMSQSISLSYH